MPTSPALALPALSQSRWLRFSTFTAFYLVQGFPIGLIQIAFPAWLTAQGLSKTQIAGFVATTTLPWGFKFIGGPIMDRFSFPAMGLRRPWVMGAQTLLVLTGCSLFFIHDPHTQLAWLTAACTVMNACAAFQDVAVDGMAVTIFRDDERGRANGFMVAGQVAGFSLTGWLCTVVLTRHGIPGAGLVTAGIVCAIGLLAFVFRERPGERLFPWSGGQAHPDAPKPSRETWTLVKQIVRRIVYPMSLLLLAVELSYRSLEGVALVWWPDVAVKHLRYPAEAFAQWQSTAYVVAASVGLAIGFAIDRVGARAGIAVGLTINAATYLVLWFFSADLATPWVGVSALLMLAVGSQWMFIATVSSFMKLCGAAIAASQFAIYMALANLGKSAGSRLFPEIDDWLGSANIHLYMVVGYVVALILVLNFSIDRHRARLAERGET